MTSSLDRAWNSIPSYLNCIALYAPVSVRVSEASEMWARCDMEAIIIVQNRKALIIELNQCVSILLPTIKNEIADDDEGKQSA